MKIPIFDERGMLADLITMPDDEPIEIMGMKLNVDPAIPPNEIQIRDHDGRITARASIVNRKS